VDLHSFTFFKNQTKEKEIGGEFFFGHLFLSIFIFLIGEYFRGFWGIEFLLSGAVILVFLDKKCLHKKINTFTTEYVKPFWTF